VLDKEVETKLGRGKLSVLAGFTLRSYPQPAVGVRKRTGEKKKQSGIASKAEKA